MSRNGVKPTHRKKLGEAIRRRRKCLILSQERLAERVGCHRNYVGNVERGEQNVTVDMLVRFANSLKVKVTSLLVGLAD